MDIALIPPGVLIYKEPPEDVDDYWYEYCSGSSDSIALIVGHKVVCSCNVFFIRFIDHPHSLYMIPANQCQFLPYLYQANKA